MESQSAAIEKATLASATNAAAIDSLEKDIDKNAVSTDERLGKVEGGMNRVEYLIGQLSEEAPVEAPVELIAMRVSTSGNTFQNAAERVDAIESDIDRLKDNLSDYIDISVPDGLIYEGNKLYLASKGQAISEPVEIVGGGGGGNASGGSYTITLTNLLESRFLSVTKNEQVLLKFRYISEDDDGYRDGSGIGTLSINGARKMSTAIEQGDNILDITPYLATGENNVQIRVTNTEGFYRTLSYTVNVVALTLTTNFPIMSTCEGDVAF